MNFNDNFNINNNNINNINTNTKEAGTNYNNNIIEQNIDINNIYNIMNINNLNNQNISQYEEEEEEEEEEDESTNNNNLIPTGNLEKQIYTNPYFKGKEKHYLRCQLSRIYHGTKLVPTLNHYTVEDQENPYKAFTPVEKPKQFKHDDLIDLKNWIHYPPSILKQGRVSHFIEPPEEADPEEFRKKEMEKDPFEKRIKPVIEDTNIKVGSQFCEIEISPWKLNQYFEDQIYINPYIKLLDEKAPDFDPLEQKDNKCDYTIICVKSLLWPGAYNFYINKTCYFFYFGFGLKFSDLPNKGPFVYKKFPDLPNDLDDLDDQPEPTIPPKEPGEEEKRKK